MACLCYRIERFPPLTAFSAAQCDLVSLLRLRSLLFRCSAEAIDLQKLQDRLLRKSPVCRLAIAVCWFALQDCDLAPAICGDRFFSMG
jgi:hypothetical protein